MTVVFTKRASQESDAARAWWAEHRDTLALGDAIAAALARITRFPAIGARVKQRGQWLKTRRYILSDVGYHLYYDYEARTQTIVVRCLWHERRRKPRL
jgi:hypothetical protein